ncbi:MAG: hypothetical protein Q4F11_00480 [Eubacteriales bacterium]|nr:hypothetical protein [Eubacteriales bacterium]
MDKYEFNLKVEQIRKLAAKKQYNEASAIARNMNWIKVKDWSTLATVINVHEAAGDFEEARDMAILAYNRNLGGRKLIYKLTEFLIKLQDFDNADQLYDEYEKASQHDVNRFILFYDLRKAEKASNNELIEILEDYKEHEIDEKYMYELAELYYKTNRKDECVKICDDIVLWFQDGVYVERAVKLKKDLNVNLTNTQRRIFDNITSRKQDIENTKELAFEEQKELARIRQDDVEEAFREDEASEDDEQQGISIDLVQNQQNENVKTIFKNALDSTEEDGEIEAFEPVEQTANSGIDKASMSLRELIENAKRKLADSYDQINQEAEQENRLEAQKQIDAKAQAMDIEVAVPDYNNLYNTQNIQEQLAKNMSDLFAEEEASLKPYHATGEETLTQEELPEDDQIEGQISLADWFESVQEERYGKQNTREFSKAELDRMLDEKDEKSAAYEKLMAEQKLKADARGEEFDEQAARQKAKAQMMINAAKTDLAIRTGKATVRLEQAAALNIAVSKTEKMAAADGLEVNEAVSGNTQDGEAGTNVTLETAELPKISEALLSSAQGIVDEENKEELLEMPRELDDVDINASSRRFKKDETEHAPMNKVDELDTQVDDDKKLSGELAKLFRKYREMPGLENQLVDYFNSIEDEMKMNNSVKGNILISGNSSSDKVDLARTIVRALNHIYPDRPKKIAKTTGDSINHRGIMKAMGKLKGTVLIVEGAGAIQPKRITEIMSCLSQDTDRMIIIFEDSDAEMNVLLNFNPQLTDTFNHRIVLKQYTVNELVEMARKFARKRQYEVDDDALLQLYLKIDQLHNSSDNIRLDDIKDIINQAIVRSEKRASKRFFGGLKKKHGENGDVIFLSEADFKD